MGAERFINSQGPHSLGRGCLWTLNTLLPTLCDFSLPNQIPFEHTRDSSSFVS